MNLKRFAELKQAGRVAPAGRAAFDAGKQRPASYSYERETAELSPEETALFQANAQAWANWQAFPPGYRKLFVHRVVDAKRPETRARRLAQLIDASAQGRKIDAMTPAPKP